MGKHEAPEEVWLAVLGSAGQMHILNKDGNMEHFILGNFVEYFILVIFKL